MILFWAGFCGKDCCLTTFGGLGFMPIVSRKSKSIRFKLTAGSSFTELLKALSQSKFSKFWPWTGLLATL